MIFLLVSGLAVLLAVLRVQTMRVGEPAVIRSALVRGGLAYLAFWIVGTGILGPAGPLAIPGVASRILLDLGWILSALLAVILWVALVDLAFYRFQKRDLVWIVPFGAASILLGTNPGVLPLAAAIVAAPALARVRWRSEVNPSVLTATALVGLLFILLYFVSVQVAGNPLSSRPQVAEIARFANWVLSLTLVYLLLSLPRLAWGMNIQIPNVKVRLLVSHLLTGLVPVVLLAIFWGLSSYLSVNSDRAQLAARQLEGESMRLGEQLSAGLASENEAAGLVSWVHALDRTRPGTRLWIREPTSLALADSRSAPKNWERVWGGPIEGEEMLASWPDSALSQGIVLVEGRAFLGAIRKDPARASFAAIVLVPLESVLEQEVAPWLDARAFLDTRIDITPAGSLITINPDSVSRSPVSTEAESSMGAAIVTVLQLDEGEWSTRKPLLRAQVGLAAALRGLTKNLSENPANLIPLIFLGGVAFLFVLVEVLTLGMVMSMGRSITRALGAIHQGTTRLREGNLRYRIPIEGHDDLWEVADSFNRMAENLEQARDLEIEQERLEGELALARQIQARLLPGEAPVLPRTELAGMSLPAREVGGDYYDFLRLPDGRLGLIIADVSGKGIPAALLMSSFRASLLSQRLTEGPAEILSRLNAFLHRSVEPGRFVTAFLGLFDLETGKFRYCNAGHNPPYVVGADGSVKTLREGGLVLGLFRESDYEEAEVALEVGDTLALFTDGVTEAQNAEEDLWGEERLLELLLAHQTSPCRRIVGEILTELRRFAGDEPQSDDITLLLARWRGPAEMSPEAAAREVAQI
jgi:serine phosphatase RsbU (regulator of sigma subunit)